MANRIVEVRIKEGPGKVRVEGITRSNRGTRIISRTVPIATEGKSKKDLQQEVALAVESFYPSA